MLSSAWVIEVELDASWIALLLLLLPICGVGHRASDNPLVEASILGYGEETLGCDDTSEPSRSKSEEVTGWASDKSRGRGREVLDSVA